jgi:Spy/CpxP family protein refolding chaperone
MKTLILAAGLALALPLAASAQTPTNSPGASGFAPGHEQKTPGGAAAKSPGHEMQDARSAGKTTTKGASEFSPGDKMNDKRGK